MKKSSDDRWMIYNFGLPAYKSCSGELTCPAAKECVKGCYARSGAYVWSNVKQACEARFEATKRADFVELMDAELRLLRRRADRQNKQLLIRIHDSGDFYSGEYLNKWKNIMFKNPDIKFYAYTKQVRLLKAYQERGLLPNNFRVIYSFGGVFDHLIDVHVDRHAAIFKTEAELIDAGYQNGTDNDLVAATSFGNKIGLVFHGFKSRSFDARPTNKRSPMDDILSDSGLDLIYQAIIDRADIVIKQNLDIVKTQKTIKKAI